MNRDSWTAEILTVDERQILKITIAAVVDLFSIDLILI